MQIVRRFSTHPFIAARNTCMLILLLCVFSVFSIANRTTSAHASGSNYYIDCSASGNGSGTQDSPWNTVDSVNNKSNGFAPGDQLLFKRGTTCKGELTPAGSGAAGSPIRIDAYGSGALPIIDGNGAADTIALTNQQYWEIANIEADDAQNSIIHITGTTGSSSATETLNYFRITNVVVHDTTNTALAETDPVTGGKNNGLIAIVAGSAYQVFSDVVIDNVVGYNGNSAEGIVLHGEDPRWRDTGRSTNITVKNTTLHDIVGDGLVCWAVNNCTFQDNVLYNIGGVDSRPNGWTTNGLWSWRADNFLAIGNEVYDQRGSEGHPLGLDLGTTNGIMEYNYTHGTGSSCIATYSRDGVEKMVNNIIRYNICADNGAVDSPVGVGTGGDGLQIYNNVLLGGFGINPGLKSEGSNPDSFENNIIDCVTSLKSAPISV